jgi:hypothetical protein
MALGKLLLRRMATSLNKKCDLQLKFITLHFNGTMNPATEVDGSSIYWRMDSAAEGYGSSTNGKNARMDHITEARFLLLTCMVPHLMDKRRNPVAEVYNGITYWKNGTSIWWVWPPH